MGYRRGRVGVRHQLGSGVRGSNRPAGGSAGHDRAGECSVLFSEAVLRKRRSVHGRQPGERAAAAMRLSVLIATRNRVHGITPCLNSIASAFTNAGSTDDEIVVVDNGSTDDTAAVLKAWANASGVRVKLLHEPRPGKSRALNCALRAAQGEILAFTDDDCRLSEDYVNDLLRHHAADREPVLRGGRIELADPTDLPFTINTDPALRRWKRKLNSAR